MEIEEQFYEVLDLEMHSLVDFYVCLTLASAKVITRQRAIPKRPIPLCRCGVLTSEPEMVLQSCRVAKAGAGEQDFYLAKSKLLLFLLPCTLRVALLWPSLPFAR